MIKWVNWILIILGCSAPLMSGAQLIGGDVNKPVNQVYYIGNNNVGDFLPTFTVTNPTTCTGTGSVRIVWNGGTTAASVRRIDRHGGLQFNGTIVTGGGSNLTSANSFAYTFTNLLPGTYTFSLSRDPYDDVLTTNNIGAGAADDYSISGTNSIGDQQRCAVIGVIILPSTGNLGNISATVQPATSCISSMGSVTLTGLTAGVTYEYATLVGGTYTSTGVIGASGNFVISNLYPGNYPIRVRVAGTTCYRELNMKVPSPVGVPCFTTDELIDFSPTGTSLIANGNFGTSSGVMPNIAGTPGITDYTLVTITSGQPQDSRYAIARSTDNADNGGAVAWNGRLRNLQYPTQGNHIFACLQKSKDHTGSTTQADGTTNGFMMVVNGHYRTDRAVFLSGLNLIQGRTYQFSFWAKNLQPFMPKNKNNATADGEPTYQPIVPRLGVVVNGIIYDYAELGYVVEPATYTASTYLTQMGWEQFKIRFTAPVNNSNSNVGIYNLQQGGFGNDFLLDDIELYEITYIGDKVWNDLNKDGRQDADEPGMANVTVTLNDASGNPIKTTVSDAFGNYKFNVPYNTSSYSVSFIAPPNYSFSSRVGTGATDATDSDPNPVTGKTDNFTLTPGSSQRDIDCGLIFNTPTQYASIGDFVWMDANVDGIQDAGESGVSGVVVSLFNSAGTLVGSTISDARGFYRFDRVDPGQYRIGVTTPPGTLITMMDASGNDANDNDVNTSGLFYGRTDLIAVAAGQTISNVDIGLYITDITRYSIGDRVWNDINNNGIQDAGEPGLPSVEVSLYRPGADNIAGTADDVFIAATITDGFGLYQFNDLDIVTYFVKLTVPAGYSVVAAHQGSSDYVDNDIDPVTLQSQLINFVVWDLNIYHIDAGLRMTNPPANWSTIGDVVWNDLDADGVQDATEPYMPAITVTLYNNSGAVVATTATDSLGYYRFVNVAPGTYTLGFSNLPDGYLFSLQDRGGNDNLDSDVDALTGLTDPFVLAGGVTNLSFDAAIRQGKNPGTGSVGNYVWIDLDLDSEQDDNETGVSGITVTLREAGANGTLGDADDLLYTTITNSLGEYSFTNLNSSHKYRVEFSNINTSWYTLAAKNAGEDDKIDSDGNPLIGSTSMTDDFGLAEGEQKIDIALGLQLTSNSNRIIGDRVWLDLNSNGVQDASETKGIPGITVDLLDVSGNLVTQSGKVLQTTTNRNGYYRFYGLNDGTYFPRFSNLPAGFVLSPLDQGGNDATDSDVSGVNGRVTAGLLITSALRTNYTADIGVMPVSSYVGDYVWNDLNGDGIQDANEPGLPGVTVTLYSATGTPLGSTVTNAAGKYYFFNVPAGTYSMGYSTYPTIMEFTRKEAAPAANGSDVDRSTGRTDLFTVLAGVNYLDIDAGLRASFIGRVGDYVWDDYDQDGIQDANEPGVAGITVQLINLNTGQVIGEAITKGNGFFQFFTVPIEVPLRAIFGNAVANFTVANQGDGTNDSKVDGSGVTISNFMLPYSSGIYNIDAGLIRPPGALPVKGLVLHASRHQSDVSLTWKTTWEANTHECLIERSTNGQQFTVVGSIPAAGNSNHGQQYAFVDRTAPAGTLYYRVKVMDIDKHTLTSNVAVLRTTEAKEVVVYPNPVRQLFYVTLPDKGSYQVRLMNAAGQTVHSLELEGSLGGATHAITRKQWPAGVYRLVITDTSGKTGVAVFNVMFD